MRPIIQGCNTVAKLQLARKELGELELERPGEEPDWVAALERAEEV